MKEEDKKRVYEFYHKQADLLADAFIKSSEQIEKEFPDGTQEDKDQMMQQIINNAQLAAQAGLESMKQALVSETSKTVKEKKNV